MHKNILVFLVLFIISFSAGIVLKQRQKTTKSEAEESKAPPKPLIEYRVVSGDESNNECSLPDNLKKMLMEAEIDPNNLTKESWSNFLEKIDRDSTNYLEKYLDGTIMHTALRSGIPVNLEPYLKKFPERINNKDIYNNSLLRLSIEYGNFSSTKQLIDMGADIYETFEDENGNDIDLLNLALRKGRRHSKANFMIKEGFPIDEGERYLIDAIEYKHHNLTDKILEKTNINTKTVNGNHIFSEALSKGARQDTIDHFLSKDLIIDDKFSKIPSLIAAAENTSITANHISKIIKLGGDVNARELETEATPLIKALKADRYEVVKALLDNNADIKLTDSTGKNVIDYVKDGKYKKLISKYF